MTWFDIITKEMNETAEQLVWLVLNDEPQSTKMIFERIYEKKERGMKRIPTTRELVLWLAKQPDIKSARFDIFTNKETKTNKNSELRYSLRPSKWDEIDVSYG